MDSLYWLTQSFYLHFLLGLIVLLGIIEGALAVRTLSNKDEAESEYLKKVYNKKLNTRMIVYGAVILIVLSSFYFNYTTLAMLIVGLFVVTVLRKKKTWIEVETGLTLVKEHKIQKGLTIKLNDKHEGKVEELELTSITISTKGKTKISMPYTAIHTLEISGDSHLVAKSLVLNFREDPKKALEHIQKLVEQLNETHKEDLTEGSEFKVSGITETNANYHGMLYTIEAHVKTEKYEEISNAVNFALADMAYENNLKMAETNVYYRTRMSNK